MVFRKRSRILQLRQTRVFFIEKSDVKTPKITIEMDGDPTSPYIRNKGIQLLRFIGRGRARSLQ